LLLSIPCGTFSILSYPAILAENAPGHCLRLAFEEQNKPNMPADILNGSAKMSPVINSHCRRRYHQKMSPYIPRVLIYKLSVCGYDNIQWEGQRASSRATVTLWAPKPSVGRRAGRDTTMVDGGESLARCVWQKPTTVHAD